MALAERIADALTLAGLGACVWAEGDLVRVYVDELLGLRARRIGRVEIDEDLEATVTAKRRAPEIVEVVERVRGDR